MKTLIADKKRPTPVKARLAVVALAREGSALNPQIAAGAPDPAKCRAVPIVQDGKTARCISETGHKCSFSQAYGSGRFCEHPDRNHIVARTLAQNKADAARLKKLKRPLAAPLLAKRHSSLQTPARGAQAEAA